ncbi:hypothetical protein BG015_010432 [Linnemannia schmuckeri]|uniref:Uncharacterized protein n=1 Tax=Linnemannia schmuckeri TaxID=64567 RepID=A0A9P5V8L2_9FUNG|nr:hypothetical protein BG015_010432 [Linnemannia schmuckeri]
MKLSDSTSSAAKLITLSMALLAVLTVINTPTIHAAPGRINVVQQADPGPPTVPIGPRGPLLNRRAGSSTTGGVKGRASLGKTQPIAIEKPEPSSGELSMHPGHEKRDDEEGKEWWEKEEWEILKRADAKAAAERKDEWWWSPKAKRSVSAGGKAHTSPGVAKRDDNEEI